MVTISFMLIISSLLNLQIIYASVPEMFYHRGDLRTTNIGGPLAVLCWSSELSGLDPVYSIHKINPIKIIMCLYTQNELIKYLLLQQVYASRMQNFTWFYKYIPIILNLITSTKLSLKRHAKIIARYLLFAQIYIKINSHSYHG